MACGNITSKTALLIISFIFWCVAGGLIFIGSWVFQTYNHYEQIASATLTLIPAVIIIGVGIMMFLIGLIGCVGGCKENRCILATFFSLLLIILTAMVIAGVLAYVYRDQVKGVIKDGMSDAVNKYGNPNNTAITNEVDYLQQELTCCGIHNYTDWVGSPWQKSHSNLTYPASCCKNKQCNYTTNGSLYQKGCFDTLKDEFKNNLAVIAGTATGFAVIQILGMICSCILFCRSREDVPYIGLENNGLRV